MKYLLQILLAHSRTDILKSVRLEVPTVEFKEAYSGQLHTVEDAEKFVKDEKIKLQKKNREKYANCEIILMQMS